jgi:hypothetical protein
VIGPMPGIVCKRCASLFGLGVRADISGQKFDLAPCIDQLVSQQAQGLTCGCWQGGLFAAHDKALDSLDAFRDDDAEFAQVHRHGVDDLRLLAHQKLPCLAHHQKRLRVLALHRSKPHGRARHGFADFLSIGSISLPALHIALHVCGLHEPRMMAEFGQFVRPVMRAGTGFHTDQAGGQALEELQHLAAPSLAAQKNPPVSVNAVQTKNRFRQIDPKRDDLVHGWLPWLAVSLHPTWHIKLPEAGAIHSIKGASMAHSRAARPCLLRQRSWPPPK